MVVILSTAKTRGGLMAKKKQRRRDRDNVRYGQTAAVAPVSEKKASILSGQPVGKFIFAAGLLIMFGGYIVLAKEFLSLAPIMILGGLGMIFAGLWTM